VHPMVQRDVHVMKIDVEGYEPFIWMGAQQLFTQHRVWCVVSIFAYNVRVDATCGPKVT
jgi:hypothetical protein